MPKPERLTSTGKLTPPLILEALGGFLALGVKINTVPMRPLERLLTFCGAFTLAHYVGAGVSDYLHLSDVQAEAVRLLVGVLGLNVSTVVYSQASSITGSFRQRIFGDSQ